MKEILLLGAGKSSTSLIKYLSDNSTHEGWNITVGDASIEVAKEKTKGLKNVNAIEFNVNDLNLRQSEISKADIIISMLPPNLHYLVAEDCVRYKRNMVTASYVSDKINSLNDKAVDAGIILLNEMGLDPGIDHLSAMMIINEIKEKGGIIPVSYTHLTLPTILRV